MPVPDIIKNQNGNIFFTLFAAVAIIGLLGTVIVSTIRGPLTTMVDVQNRTQAESEMNIASKLAILEATSQTGGGDCDGDGFVEPLEFIPGTGPVGGGTLPLAIASSRIDPWGIAYGYCAWDAGPIINDTACDYDTNSTFDRLNGTGDILENYPVIAIISAGPDQIFNTTCSDSPPAITTSGDDVVVDYTYATATADAGGLWDLKDPATAGIDKNIEVEGTAKFRDGIDLSDATFGASAQLRLGAASMILPDQTTLFDSDCPGTGNVNLDLLRLNKTSTPFVLEVCNTTGFEPATGIGLWTPGADDDLYYNNGTNPQVGINTTAPAHTLDVNGDINISSANNHSLMINGESAVHIFKDSTNNPIVAIGTGNNHSALNLGGSSLQGNTYLGFNAGQNQISGIGNTLLGTNAGSTLTTGSNNVFVGHNVGVGNRTGERNVVIGHEIGANDASGSHNYGFNVLIGGNIGTGGMTATTNRNVIIGYDSGTELTSGFENTVIGQASGNILTSGNNNIYIGNNVDASSATASNELIIGNLVYGDIANGRLGIGTSTLNDALEVAGNIDATGGGNFGNDVDVTGNITATLDMTATGNINAGGANISGLVNANDYDVNGNDFVPTACAAGSFNRWSGTAWLCENDTIGSGGGSTSALDGLSDVEAPSPNEGDCIKFNSISGDWENGPCSSVFQVTGTAGSEVVSTTNSAAPYATADFVFGSPTLDFSGDTNHENRLFFDKSKGAFRAGRTTSARWDDANIGDFSVAFGDNSQATATSSFAIGRLTNATGARSAAFGNEVSASGDDSVAFGLGNGTGFRGTSGNRSFAILSGDSGGTGPTLSGDESFAFFSGNQTGIDVTTNNIFGILGSKVVIDPSIPATQTSPSTGGEQDLVLDVAGAIGASQFCDENGNSCFTALSASGSVSELNDLTDAATDYITDFNLFIGNNAGTSIAPGGNRNIFLGQNVGTATTTGRENVYIGYNVATNSILARSNVYIGSQTGENAGDSFNNTYIGQGVGRFNTGNNNTAIGRSALLGTSGLSTGSSNTMVGNTTGTSITTGNSNVFIGNASGESITSAQSNTFVGLSSGRFNETGSNNVFIGRNAGQGTAAGSSDAQDNVIIGFSSAIGIQTGANSNTLVGNSVASALTNGNTNTFLGQNAGDTLETGDRNIIIGAGIDVPSATTSDYLSIGDVIRSDITNRSVLIGAPNTETADSDLNRSEYTLWLDETNDEFEFKAKKSDGSVITANLSPGGDTDWQIDTVNSYVFNTTDRIGIGTATPTRLLTVTGGDISLRNDGNTTDSILMTADGSTGTLSIQNGGFARVRFSSSATRQSFFDQGNFVFGAATANNSAKLQVDAATQGFLPPRNADPNANIGTPATGLMAYDTTDNELQVFNGTSWVALNANSLANSLDWDDITDTMTLDATTTIDMDTNTANLNFDANTFVIDSTNNRIGIGTSTPSEMLHILDNGVDRARIFLEGNDSELNFNNYIVIHNDPAPAGLHFRRGSGGTRLIRFLDNGQMTIGPTAPDSSAILDIQSTALGFLPPRMTTAQRDAINSGTFATGLTVYNTTTNTLQFYDGTTWQDTGSASSLWSDNTTHITRENFHVIDAGETSTTSGLDSDGTSAFYAANKAALRGGTMSAGWGGWEDANIGNDSFAWGQRAEASGERSVAFGDRVRAEATNSFAFGREMFTSGNNSFALGNGGLTVSGFSSFGYAAGNSAGNLRQITGDQTFGVFAGTGTFAHTISADSAVVFMSGNQTSVDYSTNNSFGILGMPVVIDPTQPATVSGPNTSAALDITSTNRGFLPPRMTTAQRDAINSGTFATGLTVYNTTTNTLQFYDGTTWQNAGGGAVTAAGADRQIQFNDGGSLGASAAYVYTASGDLELYAGGSGVGSKADIDMFRFRGSLGSESAAQDGDQIGFLRFNAHDGTGYTSAAKIGAVINDSSIASNSITTDLTFHTGEAGAGNERARILGERPAFVLGTNLDFADDYISSSDGTIAAFSINPDFEAHVWGGDKGDFTFTKMQGTPAAPSTIVDGDVIGAIRWAGYAGGVDRRRASITGVVNGTVTGSDVPIDILFNTTDGTDDEGLERMRITSTGEIGVRTSTGLEGLFEISSAGTTLPALVIGNAASGKFSFDANGNGLEIQRKLGGGFQPSSLSINRGTGHVGINVADVSLIDDSAQFEISSTTAGFLPPRMTTAQRDAINSGTFTTGLTVYNTTTNTLQFYDGTTWQNAGGAVASTAIDDLTDAFHDTTTDFDNNASDDDDNMFIGHEAASLTATPAPKGVRNVGVGTTALSSITTGYENTAMGYNAARDLTTAISGVYIGSQAGEQVTTGSSNVFIGNRSGWTAANSDSNVGIGDNALGLVGLGGSPATGNVALGYRVARSLRDGYGNIVIGTNAAESGDSFDQNVIIGSDTATDITTGTDNTILGHDAGDTLTTGSFNILIGQNVDASSASASNELNIGNTIYGDLSSDYIGIGIPAPDSSLHINTTAPGLGTNMAALNKSTAAIRITEGPNELFIDSNTMMSEGSNFLMGVVGSHDMIIYTAAAERIRIDETGNVGIGNASPDVALDVTGDIEYTGTLTDVSDRRLKDNITPLNKLDVLARIAKIDTYSFTMKDDIKGRTEFGVMAQELEEIFPELVHTAKDEMGTKSVNYIGLIAPMIEAAKELKSQNNALRNTLQEMKVASAKTDAELKSLSDQVALLTKMVGKEKLKNAGILPINNLALILMTLLAAGLLLPRALKHKA